MQADAEDYLIHLGDPAASFWYLEYNHFITGRLLVQMPDLMAMSF